MAEFTITIKDDENGVSMIMAGPADQATPASVMAHGLIGMAPKILARAGLKRQCNCPSCQAARAPGKPTLH
ncbi:hypothetical protein D9M70_563790 [compost metagenome]